MRMKGLSLETIPPIHIPFRFFVTAPCMGILAAVIILVGAENVFSSRWSSELLAITHLLTLGFMAMVMLGAMFQLIPVITGEMIPGGIKVAGTVHSLLCTGVLLLVAGFYWQAYWLFSWAIPIVLMAFAVFLVALGMLLGRRIGGGDSIYTIRFAALSLLIAVALGLLRAANYADLMPSLSGLNIANIHLAWGLAGWLLLLVMGVSYQVIPMFHVAPSYPSWLARSLSTAVFLSLMLLSFPTHPYVRAAAMLSLCLAAIIYALISIRLLRKRKRKVADVSARFWHLALASLIVASCLQLTVYFAGPVFPDVRWQQQMQLGIGIVMIYGFAVSVIMGMLQKIIPFLSFLHLQRSCMSNFELLKTLPHVKAFVPGKLSHWQFRLHTAALLVFVVAALMGQLVEFCALLLLSDFAYLLYTLSRAGRLYFVTARRIALHN